MKISENTQEASIPEEGKHGAPTTLAEMLVSVESRQSKKELEEYRIAYEARFGKTDLTRYYTSMWPLEHRIWLIEHEPERYFEGLPPFARAFFRDRIQNAVRGGKLDDLPGGIIRLYASGYLREDRDSWGHGR